MAQNYPGLWSQDKVEWSKITGRAPKSMYPAPGRRWTRSMSCMAMWMDCCTN